MRIPQLLIVYSRIIERFRDVEDQDHDQDQDYIAERHAFNIDCVDSMNRSALIAAIENENIELMRVLLEAGITVGDALLHAISEEYVEGVEELLLWEESNHRPGQPYVHTEWPLNPNKSYDPMIISSESMQLKGFYA